jgi:hypothetical protein
MLTSRDLIEAASYDRRRLVTAFVSGAPCGHDDDAIRPGRWLFGGLALGILLMSGAAVNGLLAGRTEFDWHQPGVIVSRGDGHSSGNPRVSVPAKSGPMACS